MKGISASASDHPRYHNEKRLEPYLATLEQLKREVDAILDPPEDDLIAYRIHAIRSLCESIAMWQLDSSRRAGDESITRTVQKTPCHACHAGSVHTASTRSPTETLSRSSVRRLQRFDREQPSV